MDSSHTRRKLLYSVYLFVPAILLIFFFGKRNRRHFLTICPQWFSQFQAPLPPKRFKHSSAGYVSSQSGMCTQERGICLVKFHILYFLWKRKYVWHSKQRVHLRCLFQREIFDNSKLQVLLYLFHLSGFIHSWPRFAMELLSRLHCVLLFPGWGNKTYWYFCKAHSFFCVNLLARHPMFTASFRKKDKLMPDKYLI